MSTVSWFAAAPALPWGVSELAKFKALLHREVDALEAGRGQLKMPGPFGARSEPTYRASRAKVILHRRNIERWQPAEPVIADHRAEAIRIVHDGLVAKGLVPPEAQRQARKGFVG